MMLNNGQRENILSCDVLVESGSFYERLSSLGSLLRNFQISSSLTAEALISEIEDLDKILRPSNTGLASRLSIFFEEVSDFVKLVNEQREPVKIREKIEQYRILFKGYAGVRHVDYIAYKPVR
jgi:hypothetical protein